jgi:dTDP-glucose pyrophosphorylase/predicted transcriptional regulator
MKNYKDILLKQTSTIKEALEVIDKATMQIALVVDNDEKLLGTLTDGDIRRGLLKNLSLDDTIKSIIFKTPVVCNIKDTHEKITTIANDKNINKIPIVDENNKVVGLKDIDKLNMVETKNNKVILMVGGLGKRLRPLTQDVPKPMLKIGNKPILETIILNFKKYGFIDIILCVNYKSEIIKEYFNDGSKFGVNIEYIYEDKKMGTTGALSLLQNKPNEPFFVMNGDLLTNINLEYMMQYHITNNSVATMCVREYDFQVPYGVIEVEDQQIQSIIEKPIHKFFVNAGIYVLSPQVLEHIPHNTFYDMPTLFNKLVEQKNKVLSFPIHEYWLDIGKISDFEQAQVQYSEVFSAK